MAYKIQWDIRAYKELKHLNNKDAIRILNLIDGLYENPQNAGEQLGGKFKGKHRIRIGDYRVIYWIKEDENTVYIISVGHRKDVYKGG